MIQIKVKKEVDRTIIIHKLKKNEQINTMEQDIIEKGEIEALFPVQIERSFLGNKLKFNIQNNMDIPSFLRSGISFPEFTQVVEQMINVFQECRSHGIRISNLETRPEYIFYNYKERKIKMLYWPLISLMEYADEKEAFRILADYYVCKPEDEKYKICYLDYFKSRKKFDLFHFKQAVHTLVICWKKDMKHIDEAVEPNRTKKTKDFVMGNITLKRGSSFLLRISNNEQIKIKSPSFLFGRDEMCDYIISGDPYVSSKHARFYIEDNQVYIVDLKSLNGVVVNNKEIIPDKKILLKNGDEIEIGYEKFIFFTQVKKKVDEEQKKCD